MSLFKEFKPALSFLGKFLLFYIVANILYGVFVESYGGKPDDATRLVAAQTCVLLNGMGYDTGYENLTDAPKVALMEAGQVVLYVYEGCNGINVMIVFIAFLFAFGGPARRLAIFLPAGLIVIHFFNLTRIGLLFYLAVNNATQFYYYHKYLFTATLYFVVFALWILWVVRLNENRNINAPA